MSDPVSREQQAGPLELEYRSCRERRERRGIKQRGKSKENKSLYALPITCFLPSTKAALTRPQQLVLLIGPTTCRMVVCDEAMCCPAHQQALMRGPACLWSTICPLAGGICQAGRQCGPDPHHQRRRRTRPASHAGAAFADRILACVCLQEWEGTPSDRTMICEGKGMSFTAFPPSSVPGTSFTSCANRQARPPCPSFLVQTDRRVLHSLFD